MSSGLVQTVKLILTEYYPKERLIINILLKKNG